MLDEFIKVEEQVLRNVVAYARETEELPVAMLRKRIKHILSQSAAVRRRSLSDLGKLAGSFLHDATKGRGGLISRLTKAHAKKWEEQKHDRRTSGRIKKLLPEVYAKIELMSYDELLRLQKEIIGCKGKKIDLLKMLIEKVGR